MKHGDRILLKVIFKMSFLFVVAALVMLSPMCVFGQVSNAAYSSISSSEQQFVVDGAVSNPLHLSTLDLAAMPKSVVSGAIYCEGDLVSEGNWGGVQISYLLTEAGADPSATCLEFHASDGYAINVSVSAALQNGLIIAYELDGQPLNEFVRLVLPGIPGNFWIDEISEIKLTMSTDYNVAPSYYSAAPMPGEVEPTSTPTPSATATLQPVQSSTSSTQNVPADNGSSPTVTIVSPENSRIYISNDVALNFFTNIQNALISYSLDGLGGVIPGNMTLTDLSNGNHTLWIFARDSSGKMFGSNVAFSVIESEPSPTTEAPAPTNSQPSLIRSSASSNRYGQQTILIVALSVAVGFVSGVPLVLYKMKKPEKKLR